MSPYRTQAGDPAEQSAPPPSSEQLLAAAQKANEAYRNAVARWAAAKREYTAAGEAQSVAENARNQALEALINAVQEGR